MATPARVGIGIGISTSRTRSFDHRVGVGERSVGEVIE
jgi:hypothetical protein